MLQHRTENRFSPQYYAVALRGEFYRLKREEARASRSLYLDDIDFDILFEDSDECLRLDISAALASLSKKQKKVIYLRDIAGFKVYEAAEILGISRQAFHRTRKRALSKMREHFE